MIGRRNTAATAEPAPPDPVSSDPVLFDLVPTVVTADEQDAVVVDAERLGGLATAVLCAEGVRGGELSLSFVDEATIAELNITYLGGDGPTDVLAFPLDPAEGSGEPGPVLLGDVIVCPAVAGRYAAEVGRALQDELALLVVHGVLHVLGHDHAEPAESAVMRAAEERHLTEFYDPAWTWSGS